VSLLNFPAKGSYFTSFYGQQCLCVENSYQNFHYTQSIYLSKGLLHQNYSEACMAMRLLQPNESLDALLQFWRLFIDLAYQLRNSNQFIVTLPT